MLVQRWKEAFTPRERMALALGCGLALIAVGRGGSVSAALGSWVGVLGLYLAGSGLAWRLLRVSLEQKEKGDAVASTIALLVFQLSALVFTINGLVGAFSVLGGSGFLVAYARLQAYMSLDRFWPVEPYARLFVAFAFSLAVFVGGPEARRVN